MAEDDKFRMRKVKSIDDIYAECQKMEVDYVVSCDAPLVTALNSRCGKPLHGFAFTPLQLADSFATELIGAPPDTDLQVSRKMMHITGYGLRFVHSTVRRIREIRRYTFEVEKYLLSRKEKEAYQAYLQTCPVDGLMNMYDVDYHAFFKGQRTAVVDTEFLTSLDKRMCPVDREEISNADLEDVTEDFAIDRIYSIGNDRQIAECVADLINIDNCNDVAVVLDAGGSIAEAVRSALYRRNIPFKNELTVKDLAPIRDFLRFLGAALNFSTIRCGGVRELFNAYGATYKGLSQRTDNYLLCKITEEQYANPREPDKTTTSLIALMRDIYEGKCTFFDAVGRLPKKEGLSSVKILLRDMEIGDDTIDRDGLADMEYAVNNVDDLKHNEQIPDDERRGVLLADAKKSIYIDRSLIFFIGLDDSWHNSPAGKDYIEDPVEFEEKEAKRLRILLQQGDTRIYMVRPATDGKETVPCQSFELISQIEGRPRLIKSFKDICGDLIRGSWHKELPGSARPDVSRPGGDPGPVEKFSKTDYNKWRDCPYKYAFGKVLKNDYEDNKNALFGNYVHEFCEYCFCYPEYARENFDEIVGKLLASYSGISQTCLTDLDASRFRTLMTNALFLITAIRPTDLVLDDDNSKRKYPNMLIAADPRTGNRCSSLVEAYLDSKEGHHLYAKFDLCVENNIYDWKTGRIHDAKHIVEGFEKRGESASEVQPLMYLQALREALGSDAKTVRFNLVYLGAHSAVLTREGDSRDLTRNIRKVEFVDMDDGEFWDHIRVFDAVRDAISTVKAYDVLYEMWDAILPAIKDLAQSPGWCEPGRSEDALFNATGLKDLKKNRDAVAGLIKKFAAYAGPLVTVGDTVYVRREYMDGFVEILDKDAADAAESLSLPFFAKQCDKVYCTYCEYVNVCMSPLASDFVGGDSDGSE